MVHMSVIESRLSQLGIRPSRLSRPELIELQHLLMDDEKIVILANGRYFAGFATIVATDIRLLIIDKRPFFLTVEDIRYDMISELDYSSRLMDATLHIFTINKQHRFTSFVHRKHLQTLTKYVQQRVMELRQHQQQPLTQFVSQDLPPPPQPVPLQPPQQPMPDPPEPPNHTDTPPMPNAAQEKTYRQMASRFSGRVLGPVAVNAAHHQIPRVMNPYARASLVVKHSGNWISSHTPHAPQTDPVQPAVQAEL